MIIKPLGRAAYAPVESAMRAFTEARTPETPDELWLVEHDPVFTQGLAGKEEHLLVPGDIPVIQTNRGGQVTYHGPGQVTAYPLVDLRRLNIFVKEYVFRLEAAVIQTLDHFGIVGHRVAGAPGIYVRLADPGSHAALTGPFLDNALDKFQGLGKVAALGIKVTRHCTYHGVALNVNMDLEPYARINPCGYAGLETVDLVKLGVSTDWATVAEIFGERLTAHLTP